MRIDSGWTPRIGDDIAWVEVDGEVVVVDPEREQVHLLSGSGALLWQLFDGESSAHEIAADVADVFGLDAGVALDDVLSFATRMLEAGLLEPGGVEQRP